MTFAEATYYIDTAQGRPAQIRPAQRRPAQGRTPFLVSIGAPVPHPEGDFTCVLRMGDESEDVGGIDPIQCLTLATSRLRQRLALLSEAEGLQLFLGAEDTEPLHPSSLFPLAFSAPWDSGSNAPY